MAETHDLGRLYVHGMRVPWLTPPIQLRGISHEIEEPWRIGHCVVLRLLFLPYAIVIGWWGRGRTYEEMEAAEQAAAPVVLPTAQIREDFIPQQAR